VRLVHDVERLGEPKIEHLHHALRRDLDVGGLQVSVDDAPLVRRLDGFGELPRNVQRFVERPRAGEILPLDELHHDGALAATVLEPVDRGDMGMIERG
jgi:hypothetical protein